MMTNERIKLQVKANKSQYMSIFKINKLVKISSLKKSYSLENQQINNEISGSTCEKCKIAALDFMKCWGSHKLSKMASHLLK